ncbi:MAG: RNA polymerase-binding transcription factor CarD [Firmicutes bacterium ADurb.Bin193]|nr:MAG: RNA polymerase-binding transcription factor CarD [Firmicutes bacterium ADurb.Bin193]
MYNIGDKIVYPMHGAGIIEAIEEKKFLKKKQSYYIMRMPIGDMKVMIPINNTKEIGIRTIIDNSTACEILAKFKCLRTDVNENWNKRYRENMIKIRSGDILEVLDVVKSLMLRDRCRGLSTSERKMLNNAKQIVISELVLAQVALQEEIEKAFEDMIDAEINT